MSAVATDGGVDGAPPTDLTGFPGHQAWQASLEPEPPAFRYDELVRTAMHNETKGYTSNPYRIWSTRDLLDQKEYLEYCLVEYQLRKEIAEEAEPMELMLEWFRHNHGQLERELARRRNLIKDSGRQPTGLNLTQRGYIDLDAVRQMIRIEYAVDRLSINHQLVARGPRRLWTSCFLPGHMNDDTASFMVEPEKQSFHCFGCARGGDVVNLAAHFFADVRFPVAIESLCKLLGFEVPRKQDRPASGNPRALTANGSSVDIDQSLIRPLSRRGGRW